MPSTPRLARFSLETFLLAGFALLLSACGSGDDFSALLEVHVRGANRPLGPSEVTLYSAVSGRGPQILSQATTSPEGFVGQRRRRKRCIEQQENRR